MTMARGLASVAAFVMCAGCALTQTQPVVPAEGKVEMKTAVSRHGITWTFEKPAPVGQFVNGDYYVVGPVTVVRIEPPATGSMREYRNGSMLNPPTDSSQGYDGRMKGFRQDLAVKLPVAMKPGDSLVSTISLEGKEQNLILPNPTKNAEDAFLRSAAVLTCLAESVPADAFRPGYCDLKKERIRLARNILWEKLPRIKPVKAPLPAGQTGESMKNVLDKDGMPRWDWAERAVERLWLDHLYSWGNREIQPIENRPGYGREVGRTVSYLGLMLCLDAPKEKKQKVGIGLIQIGIDNWSVATRSKKGVMGGWPAQGGFGNGRKLPIVLAAVLLNDEEMLQIQKYAAEASFGEDEHVEFGPCWTGATVRFRGQYPLSGQTDRGPYEHLPPAQWPGQNKTMSESYRRCCTSVSWVGQALVVHLLKAEKVWDHDAFFAYVDRWMYEDDTKFVEEIEKAYPGTRMMRQGTTHFDPWIDEMWKAYRTAPGMPPTDGWKKLP